MGGGSINMKHSIIPIDRSESPSRYYRVNYKKKIKNSTKLLRFLVRYFIPVLVVSGAILFADIHLSLYNSTDKVFHATILISCTIVFSLLAVLIANSWFRFISKNEDKEEE